MNRYKRMLLIIIVGMLTLLLTGCDEDMIQYLDTDLKSTIQQRVELNRSCATSLREAGIISESEYNSVMKSIDSQMAIYMEDISKNSNLQKKLLASASAWAELEFKAVDVNENNDEINAEGFTRSEWNSKVLTNAIAGFGSKANYDQVKVASGSGYVEPINLMDNVADEINDRFGYPIYVLRPFDELENEGIDLDGIKEMVNLALKDPNKVDTSLLDRYFTPAKDEEDKIITLLDTSKRENQVIVTSDGADTSYVGDPSDADVNNRNKVLKKAEQFKFNLSGHSANQNRPGKDMIIQQYGYNIMAVRFTEFNYDAVQKIIKTIGLTDSKYIVTNNDGGRVYLVEYPVYTVDSFVEDGDSFDTTFEQSNLGINLKTGKMIKYEGAYGGENTLTGINVNNDDPYLTMAGAENETVDGQASFIVKGNIDKPLILGEKNQEVITGRIILRDYLEGTYAPGIVSDENVVVFGRKLRIENFSGSKDLAVARFYDKEGKKIEESTVLHISDFASMEDLISGQKLKYIRGKGEASINSTEDEEETEGTEEDNVNEDTSYEEIVKDAILKIDNLPRETAVEIKPTEAFPSENIGSIDVGNNDKPLFYVMAVKKSMFETGLFSGWIYNTDESSSSLPWWSKWLYDHGYQYKIDKTILEEYLMGNYSFELGNQGILVLDLETIAKIQQQYNEQDIIDQNRTIRTIFMLLGAVLIGYSVIMLLAWVLDTSVDLGFNILEKMTFGNMIAVTDESELPVYDTEDRKYIAFGRLVQKSIILTITGIMLILVDFYDIAYWLIRIFGGIAQFISKAIFQ